MGRGVVLDRKILTLNGTVNYFIRLNDDGTYAMHFQYTMGAGCLQGTDFSILNLKPTGKYEIDGKKLLLFDEKGYSLFDYKYDDELLLQKKQEVIEMYKDDELLDGGEMFEGLLIGFEYLTGKAEIRGNTITITLKYKDEFMDMKYVYKFKK